VPRTEHRIFSEPVSWFPGFFPHSKEGPTLTQKPLKTMNFERSKNQRVAGTVKIMLTKNNFISMKLEKHWHEILIS